MEKIRSKRDERDEIERLLYQGVKYYSQDVDYESLTDIYHQLGYLVGKDHLQLLADKISQLAEILRQCQ